MLTGEIKAILIETLSKYLVEFQERRKKVTDEDVRKFMEVRTINAMPKKFEEFKKAQAEAAKKAKEDGATVAASDEKKEWSIVISKTL